MQVFEKKYVLTILLVIFIAAFLGVSNKVTAVDFDPFASNKTETQHLSKSILEKGPVIPEIQLSNNDISMAFHIISDATGWSIFPTAEVSRTKVSLWAKNVTAKELLDTVVTLAGFTYYVENKVITVTTYDEYMQYYGVV